MFGLSQFDLQNPNYWPRREGKLGLNTQGERFDTEDRTDKGGQAKTQANLHKQ